MGPEAMGRKKNNGYIRHAYETKHILTAEHSPFTMIFDDLFFSEEFTALSARQRILWVFCRMRAAKNGAPNTPAADNPDSKKWGKGEPVFYMNYVYAESLLHLWSNKTFYKDLRELCKRGFIDYEERRTKEKSVFRLSSRWQGMKGSKEK